MQEMQGKGLPNVSEVSGKHQLELLRGISGAFRPGILTCLMGVSGAGKTTLMDVLSGRKTGQQRFLAGSNSSLLSSTCSVSGAVGSWSQVQISSSLKNPASFDSSIISSTCNVSGAVVA